MEPVKGSLLVRADAGQEIGTGHVMRCLALAQAWQSRGGNAAIFAMAMKPPAVESRLRSEGQEIAHISAAPGSAEDAAQTVAVAREKKVTFAVVDGYHFAGKYQRILTDAGLRVVVVDDFGQTGPCHASVLLNQNLHANESLYAGLMPRARLLLGPRYALLRREFWPLQGWNRTVNPKASKVLVTLGGADPDNVTLKVIDALRKVQEASLEVVVVIGGSNRHFAELQKAVVDFHGAIRLERDATNMPELLTWADVAVSGGGSTCWEIAFVGLPSLVISLDERQLVVGRELESRGIAVNMGVHSHVSPVEIGDRLTQLLLSSEDRSRMSSQGQYLLDGRGAERVVSEMSRELQRTPCVEMARE